MPDQSGDSWLEAPGSLPILHRSAVPEVMRQVVVSLRPQLEGLVAEAAAGLDLDQFRFPVLHGSREVLDLVDLAQVLSQVVFAEELARREGLFAAF
jgi:hypothetical protein